MHRLLQRQIKRALGATVPDDLPAQIAAELRIAGPLPPTLERVLTGFAALVERIDASYDQNDRDLDLRTRSLDLSSAELTAANERLRADIAARNRAAESLRTVLAELAGRGVADAATGDAADGAPPDSLEALSQLIHRLVSEREQQRRKLDDLKHALDEHAIISIANADGHITYANDRFCAISGYAREELLGQSHRMIRSNRHPPEFFADLWNTITAGKVWHSEICNHAKAGHEYWVSATIVPVVDDAGQPQEYIAIRTDITEQKQVEQRLALYQAHLETLLRQHQEAQAELERARARELSIGAQIQRSLLLSDVPAAVGPLTIVAHTEPSQGIDGDFHEFLSYTPDLLDITIGDVMGKGVPAALIGAAVKQQMTRVIATLGSGSGAAVLPTPADLVNALHRKLTPRLIDLESFVTLAYLRFDLARHRVTFVDAGHPHVIVVGDGGLRVLAGDNLPLGVLVDESYRQFDAELQPGDLLFLFSDGVTEARDATGTEFGFDRLAQLLLDLHAKALPAEMVLQVVRRALRTFEQRELVDDRTCIVLQFDPGGDGDQPKHGFSMPRQLAALATLRHEIAVFAQQLDFAEEARDALILAGFEAATNIIRHSPSVLTDEMLHCQLDGGAGQMSLRLYYLGEAFIPTSTTPDFSGASEGGFGLYIIENCVDEVTYASVAPGVGCVSLRKRGRDSDPHRR